MRKHYYWYLAKYLEEAKYQTDKIKKIKEWNKVYRKLRKRIPQLTLSIDKYAHGEFTSEWVNKNWTDLTEGGGHCGGYYLRGYIKIDGHKIYSEYKAYLGYEDSGWFHDKSEIEEDVKHLGEGIREPMEKAIENYHKWYDGDDEEDY